MTRRHIHSLTLEQKQALRDAMAVAVALDEVDRKEQTVEDFIGAVGPKAPRTIEGYIEKLAAVVIGAESRVEAIRHLLGLETSSPGEPEATDSVLTIDCRLELLDNVTYEVKRLSSLLEDVENELKRL